MVQLKKITWGCVPPTRNKTVRRKMQPKNSSSNFTSRHRAAGTPTDPRAFWTLIDGPFNQRQLDKERTSSEKRKQHFVTRRTEWSWVQTQLFLRSFRRPVAPPIGRQSRSTKKSEHKVRFFQKNTIISSTGQRRSLMKTTIEDSNIVASPPPPETGQRSGQRFVTIKVSDIKEQQPNHSRAGSLSLHRETFSSMMPPGQKKTIGQKSTTSTSSKEWLNHNINYNCNYLSIFLLFLKAGSVLDCTLYISHFLFPAPTGYDS
ncbi:hypothetical protein CRE_23597 [Caenorhabditis remanei]|uniref:Uncharacterized protein n=1 Tax=Caenorhabditis remanei TaxID=31234 RepID=E3MVR1_CAERE|nr:hypothetical protein CRE_23597 [Caenorhabditis remanei]